MENISEYQRMRGSNLGKNWQILAELGVKLPNPNSHVVLRKVSSRAKPLQKKSPKSVSKATAIKNTSQFQLRVRLKTRSLDPEDIEEQSYGQESDSETNEEDQMEHPPRAPRHRVPRPNAYGKVEGVKVGEWWRTRLDCSADGIHRPTVAGIHPGPEGAYSVAISGGYEDDVDFGESFTYTGEGGRDLKGTVNKPKNLRTAPQSKDQCLIKGNLALARSVESGNPIRVIRGYKLNNEFSPSEGYRYDGLYQVKKYWEATGKAGFKVFKFAFVRCDDEPAPWTMVDNKPEILTQDNKYSLRERKKTKGIESDDEFSYHEPNENENPNRKTVALGPHPGVTTSVDTSVKETKPCSEDLSYPKLLPQKEDPENCSAVSQDMDWRGWEKVNECRGDCLVVEFNSVATKVRLEKDLWNELSCTSSFGMSSL